MVTAKCIIQYCSKEALKSDLIKTCCRAHCVSALEALSKHLPRTGAGIRRLFLQTPPGKTWFMDWVRLEEGIERARLEYKEIKRLKKVPPPQATIYVEFRGEK